MAFNFAKLADRGPGWRALNPIGLKHALPHLRSYQLQALEDLVTRWDAGSIRVPMVLATGLGKTEIFSPLEGLWVAGNEYATALHVAYGLGARVLVLAHTDELIEQAARKARQRNPGLTVGIVKAALNQAHAQIVVSSRQTLASEKRRNAIRNVGLIIVDEAHHALRSNTYGKILEHFGAWPTDCPNCYEGQPMVDTMACPYGPELPPKVKVAGFTATLARGDKGKLSTVWEECTFKRDILFGIRHGYLLDVRGQRVVVPDLNMSNVKTQGGDFQDASIAEELERTFAPQIIAEKYAEVARDETGALRSGIAFWPLVETAYHGAEAFVSAGITSAVIHGGLPKEERKLILKRFQAGEITVVHNCMVLTEGFDAPWCDVVVIARPTRSAPLYQQMVGRVLRPDLTKPAAERGKALILDVVGAGASNDLRSLIDLSPERVLPNHGEDLSLLELEDEYLEFMEARGSGIVLEDESFIHDGPTEVIEFDPLHRKRTWDQTPGGTFFMGAGTDGYIWLHEMEPAAWDVVWCEKRVGGAIEATEHRGISLEEAIVAGEDEALIRGGVGSKTLTTRSAPWRKEPASDAQKSSFHYLYKEGMTKGEMKDAIDHVSAARRIDPIVVALKNNGGKA